jgi:hypothetical protein
MGDGSRKVEESIVRHAGRKLSLKAQKRDVFGDARLPGAAANDPLRTFLQLSLIFTVELSIKVSLPGKQ